MKIKYALILFFSISIFYACNKEQELIPETSFDFTIKSQQDFQNRVDAKVYPLTELSAGATDHFKENLLFTEGNQLKGGDYSQIRKELNDEEFAAFWNSILGLSYTGFDDEPITTDALEALPRDPSPEPMVVARDSNILKRRPIDCWPVLVQTFCVVKVPDYL